MAVSFASDVLSCDLAFFSPCPLTMSNCSTLLLSSPSLFSLFPSLFRDFFFFFFVGSTSLTSSTTACSFEDMSVKFCSLIFLFLFFFLLSSSATLFLIASFSCSTSPSTCFFLLFVSFSLDIFLLLMPSSIFVMSEVSREAVFPFNSTVFPCKASPSCKSSPSLHAPRQENQTFL